MKRITGYYEKIGTIDYFIPHALPPQNPLFKMDDEMTKSYGAAMLKLGQLNEIAANIPDKKRFIKAYVIKEALLSSAIEGIHTTLLDVFTQPLSDSKPNKDTQLVVNYTHALDKAISMVKDEGMPIVSRVILSAHEALMRLGESDAADPGNYRKQSVRVGNLVPPQATKIAGLIADLEKFINEDNQLPPLIKAGLAHVQFETIHPFLDGNGRIGRLLIVLMLMDSNLLSTPILYPSYYFKKYHAQYYAQLDRVRTHGDFEGWIKYYLMAIEQSSEDAYKRIKDIEQLEQEIKKLIHTDQIFSRIHDVSVQALNILFQFPVINATQLSMHIKKSYNTANTIIQRFMQAGILVINKSQQRNKLYRFDHYLKLLEKEY